MLTLQSSLWQRVLSENWFIVHATSFQEAATAVLSATVMDLSATQPTSLRGRRIYERQGKQGH